MKRVNLSLTNKYYNLLKKEAEKRGESLSSINREAVEAYFNSNITNDDIMKLLKEIKLPSSEEMADNMMKIVKHYYENPIKSVDDAIFKTKKQLTKEPR
jgi:metal-responsive CopG/Arc/MetJ family transcriptional regulator